MSCPEKGRRVVYFRLFLRRLWVETVASRPVTHSKHLPRLEVGVEGRARERGHCMQGNERERGAARRECGLGCAVRLA